MENQPIARLSFTCDRNWEDMIPVKDGRFCNDCQKKVVDFTDKTNDEIAAYLMSSTTKVCGRFQQSQLVSPLPKPLWKRWFSAAAMFAAVFMGIKEALAQEIVKQDTVSKLENNNVSFGGAGIDPRFPGGEDALKAFLNKNLHATTNVKGRVMVSFVVEKDGSLTGFMVLKGLGKEADVEAIRVLKAMPDWQPAIQSGHVVRVAYVMPVSFGGQP